MSCATAGRSAHTLASSATSSAYARASGTTSPASSRYVIASRAPALCNSRATLCPTRAPPVIKIVLSFSCILVYCVSPELITQSHQDLPRVARCIHGPKSKLQRGGNNWHRNTQCLRRLDHPGTLTRLRHLSRDLRQMNPILFIRIFKPADQARLNHTAVLIQISDPF